MARDSHLTGHPGAGAPGAAAPAVDPRSPIVGQRDRTEIVRRPRAGAYRYRVRGSFKLAGEPAQDYIRNVVLNYVPSERLHSIVTYAVTGSDGSRSELLWGPAGLFRLADHIPRGFSCRYSPPILEAPRTLQAGTLLSQSWRGKGCAGRRESRVVRRTTIRDGAVSFGAWVIQSRMSYRYGENAKGTVEERSWISALLGVMVRTERRISNRQGAIIIDATQEWQLWRYPSR